MNWPFLSRARHLEDVAALRVQLATTTAKLEAAELRAEAAETDRDLFRHYYERLADDTLMRRGDAAGPVHENPERKDLPANQLARGFALVGSHVGAPITGPPHAANHAKR